MPRFQRPAITTTYRRASASARLRQLQASLNTQMALLRESEARFRRAFDHAAIGMALVAPDGRCLQVNQAICQLFGYSEQEMLKLDYQTLTYPDDQAREVEYLRQLISRETDVLQYEKRYIHRDGHTIWAILTASFVYSDHGQPLYFVSQIQDITSFKQAEGHLQALNQQLNRNNRELQEFAAIASHDLQEPLRKIQAFGERLRRQSGLDTEGLGYLDRMVQAARRMQQLITNLLAFSRLTSKLGNQRQVALTTIAQEVVSDLEAQLERTGGQISIGALPMIEADPTQMRQLFQNLLSNALKFHRPGLPPVVTISSHPVTLGTPLEAGTQQSFYQIDIQDNGIGFDEGYRELIFAAFQRLHHRDVYEGSGIGLAICRRIVERHGGSISAHSIPGQGATFSLIVPASQRKEVE